jgi:hypothetical protein
MMNTPRIIAPIDDKVINNPTGDEHSKRIKDKIDAIRIRLYERTKHMTASEFTAFVNKEVPIADEKYGFQMTDRIEPPKSNSVDKKTD